MQADFAPGSTVGLQVPAYVEHVRYRGRLPGMPLSMDYDGVPCLQAMVQAFRLVHAGVEGLTTQGPSARNLQCPVFSGAQPLAVNRRAPRKIVGYG